jgi:hypothetical protein
MAVKKDAERLGTMQLENNVVKGINMTAAGVYICKADIRAHCSNICAKRPIVRLIQRLEWLSAWEIGRFEFWRRFTFFLES